MAASAPTARQAAGYSPTARPASEHPNRTSAVPSQRVPRVTAVHGFISRTRSRHGGKRERHTGALRATGTRTPLPPGTLPSEGDMRGWAGVLDRYCFPRYFGILVTRGEDGSGWTWPRFHGWMVRREYPSNRLVWSPPGSWRSDVQRVTPKYRDRPGEEPVVEAVTDIWLGSGRYIQRDKEVPSAIRS